MGQMGWDFRRFLRLILTGDGRLGTLRPESQLNPCWPPYGKLRRTADSANPHST